MAAVPSFGIEEEFFLTDLSDGHLASRIPDEFFERCSTELGPAFSRELLRSQVELVSPIFAGASIARRTMRSMRSRVATIARSYSLGLTAAGTHPMGFWHDQAVSEGNRGRVLESGYKMLSRRNLVCGLHVHAGIPDGVDRVGLMNRLLPWTPLFLALSSSSPFWNGRLTGLYSYRQAAYDEWPRTGLPGPFVDDADLARYTDILLRTRSIDSPRSLWWVIRPSHRFPTLELRIADSCTRVDDTVAIAILYWCLVQAMLDDPDFGEGIVTARWPLIDENRWRAQRHGGGASLIDPDGSLTPLATVLQQLLALLSPVAEKLGCSEEIARLPRLLTDGTSAWMQRRIFQSAFAEGNEELEALHKVVAWLVATTSGIDPCEPGDFG